MEPPRLSLVPSSQDVNDNAPDDTGAPEALGGLPRNVMALPFAAPGETAHPRGVAVRKPRAARPGGARPAFWAERGCRGASRGAAGPSMPRAASISCGSPANGPSAPPRIWPSCSSGRPSSSAACRVRRSRPCDHRLSPAGHPRRDRGDQRREHVQGHGRRAARDRLDQARGRRRAPGRPVTYGTTEAVPRPISGSTRSRTCRALPS